MTEPDPKAAARSSAFAACKAAHLAGGKAAATAALLAEIGPVTGQAIAGYMAIRTELDPMPAMGALARDNRICVPVIQAAGQPLRFREWTPGCSLVKGAFGAAIPAEGDWLEPDILIVPLVAFDAEGNRLGYGGGFYDRTLEGLRARGPVRAIGYAYSGQMAADLPLEPTDQPLDVVITERGPLARRADSA